MAKPPRYRRPPPSPGDCIFWLAIGAIVVFLLLPTLIVLPMSIGESPYIEFPPKGFTLRWYVEFFGDADWIGSILFSLRIAIATTAAATVIGTLAAFAMVRGRLPGSTFVYALTLTPLIVPHIVIAVALFLVFAPIGLTGNFFGFLLAHTSMAVPYVVITVTASLKKFDPTLELAAQSCGASRARAFRSVVLPNIFPGVAAGALFAFLASFDEATVAFFISGVEGKTVTRKMFEDIDYNLTPVIAVAATVMVVVSLSLMSLIGLARRRR
jgi:mannopine transport system permease protein